MWSLSLSLRPAQGENVVPYQEEEDCSVWLCWLHFSVSSMTQPIQSQRPPICTGLRVSYGQVDQFSCLFFILARNKDADQGLWMLAEREGCPVRIILEETIRNLKENKGRVAAVAAPLFGSTPRSVALRATPPPCAPPRQPCTLPPPPCAPPPPPCVMVLLLAPRPLRACSQGITVDELLWMPNSPPEEGLDRGSVGRGSVGDREGGVGFPLVVIAVAKDDEPVRQSILKWRPTCEWRQFSG